MNNIPQRVVVIGAGVAGLAAARYLKSAGMQVTVLEKKPYVGGRVHTDCFEGFKVDTGAQFMTNFYAHTQQIISDLNLQDAVIPITGGASIVRNGKLHQIFPTTNMISSSLISFRSKLTLLKILAPMLRYWNDLDIYAFYKLQALDMHSISEYVHQELDDELLDYLFEPLLSGILYWTPGHTSQAMLFPMLKACLGMKLFTLKDSLGSLPEAMAVGLEMQCNAEVISVASAPSGGYTIEASVNGKSNRYTSGGIVCAIPATTVSKLFPFLSAEQHAFFDAVRYSASVNTAIVFNRRFSSEFYSIFCPSYDFRYLATMNVESAKNSSQIPQGRDLIELFPSATASRELLLNDDASIKDKLCTDTKLISPDYDLSDNDCAYRVYRWDQALPEFDVGHLKRLKAFADDKIESDHIVFAGDYIGGPYIEGAIHSGFQAARRLLNKL